jgi:hypothetical protein
MIWRRFWFDRLPQSAISSSVRQHPAHNPVSASIVQILMQGVSIATRFADCGVPGKSMELAVAEQGNRG